MAAARLPFTPAARKGCTALGALASDMCDVLLSPLECVTFKQVGELDAPLKEGRDMWLVGHGDHLRAAGAALAAECGNDTIALQADAAAKADYAGTKKEVSFVVGGAVRTVSILGVPEGRSRIVCPTRPDIIAKHLHNKVRGKDVLLAVGEEGVTAASLAVARCLPTYTSKTKAFEPASCTVRFYGCEPGEETLTKLNTAAESIRIAQGLTDMPPNYLNPQTYKDVVLKAVEGIPGVKPPVVIEDDALREAGYGGLWSVGKSAAAKPVLLVLTHEGAGAEGKTGVALVGKGITFDTGGAALKSREGMCGMKRDMGGSAGLFGAWLTAAKCGGIGRPLHLVLCLAENAIGPEMFLQDDILSMYSGLTVEVNNTDAEGRLVLADGVAHAVKHLNVDLVVDMATLTGAQGISTGINHGMILATDEDLEREAIAAGKSSGDGVHPGLFAPEMLMHEFDSEFADMKNSVKDRGNAQASCAGMFIYKHLVNGGYSGKWLHVDMASPVHKPLGEYSTGFGVGLVSRLLGVL